MSRRSIFYTLGVLALTAALATYTGHGHPAGSKETELPKGKSHDAAAKPARYSLGRPASAADFVKHDYLIGPKGTGLPKGHGTASEGRAIYMQSCAACHGLHGEGTSEYPPLVDGRATLKSDKPLPTVGSYWPYATTVWDYINRAMPYPNPGTLKPDEIYAVTAYLLAMNGIVPENFELNERTLPQVKMPNRGGFIPDPRPDVK